MQFSEIVGQESLKQRLVKTVVEGRVSHAQLFLGQCGFGSLPLAIAYAQFIHCTNKQAEDSCGECNSCKKIEKLAHPDLHFSFPIAGKDKPTSDTFITDWREINLDNPYFGLDNWHQKIEIDNKQSIINVHESQRIIKKLSLKAFESEFKVLIIWKAENMNVDASNKLLKLIEEPTDKTIILMVVEDEELLLPTIRSRTQITRVPPINSQLIATKLMEELGVDLATAQQSASLSEGNLSTAKEKVKQSDEDEYFFELFKNWMRACYEANIEKMHQWVEEMSSKSVGREGQKRFLNFALEIMREGLIRNYGPANLNRFDGDVSTFMKKFAPFVHENNVFGIVEILSDAHFHISRNAYPKILFMDMSMKFANLLRIKKRTFVS
ncbi:MAG: DNA polymerase III subunit delta' [Vicingaceae bacterium]